MKRWVRLAVVIATGAASLGATRPYQNGPLAPIPEECRPATAATAWYDDRVFNDPPSHYGWEGTRDLTLICLLGEDLTPCSWCYRVVLEKRVNFTWVVVAFTYTDLGIPCDDSIVTSRIATATGLAPGTRYKMTSSVAQGPCDSAAPYSYFSSIEFITPY